MSWNTHFYCLIFLLCNLRNLRIRFHSQHSLNAVMYHWPSLNSNTAYQSKLWVLIARRLLAIGGATRLGRLLSGSRQAVFTTVPFRKVLSKASQAPMPLLSQYSNASSRVSWSWFSSPPLLK